MFNQHFSRRVPTQVKWMFILVILPLYMYCGSLILSALFKFIILQFHIQFDYNQLNAYLNLIFDLILLVLAGWLLKDSMIEQFKDFKKNIKNNLFYGCIVGVLMIYVCQIIGGLLTLALGGNQTSENQQLIESITTSYPVIMIFVSCILAPIVEEMLFRGIVFGWIYEWNPKMAHLISAFIFGFIHIMSAVFAGNLLEWVQIFSYGLMGFALSYLYEKQNNIYVPILSHMMNNIISMCLVLL